MYLQTTKEQDEDVVTEALHSEDPEVHRDFCIRSKVVIFFFSFLID